MLVISAEILNAGAQDDSESQKEFVVYGYVELLSSTTSYDTPASLLSAQSKLLGHQQQRGALENIHT